MKFAGLMCAGTKNIGGKCRCKPTSTKKVIVLAFICVYPHPVHSIEWRIYVCVNPHRRC